MTKNEFNFLFDDEQDAERIIEEMIEAIIEASQKVPDPNLYKKYKALKYLQYLGVKAFD